MDGLNLLYRYFILGFLALVVAQEPIFFYGQEHMTGFEHEMLEEEEEEEMPKMRRADERIRQEFEMTRIPGTNEVPRERLLRAREVAKRSRVLRSSGIPLTWEERGPSNVGGRTRAVCVDANDPTGNTVLAAGVAGGLWRTTNFKSASPSWTPIDDFFDNIAVSSIIQDPEDSNIMYFGTGEGWFNFDAVRGLGIWKSTDGGSTWTHLQSTVSSTFHYVQDLIIDPNGAIYASTRNGGVMRSQDGGASWSSVLSGSQGNAPTNRAADLELGADGSLYATMGIFSTGRIYRSAASEGVNQGNTNTWTDITPSGSFYRIELATAPSDANRLYAVCQGNGSNGVSAMFRSENAGSTWISITVPGFCDAGGSTSEFSRGQAWYDLIAAVDPNNQDVLFVGGVDALRSTDGGITWTQVSGWAQDRFNYCSGQDYIHADHHAILFVNNNSNEMIWGTDGGLYYTSNANNSLPDFASKNTGYNVTQFYSAAIHPDAFSDHILGGTQDNGTHRFSAPGMNNTYEVTGGDGGFCHIDQTNPNIQITSYVYNNYYLSTNGGSSFSGAISNNTGKFINISDYDNDAGKLYAATNSGKFLRWNNPREGGNDYDIVSASFGGSVTAVFCDPNQDNRVWFGTSGPTRLVRIDNAHDVALTETEFTVPSAVNGAYMSSIDLVPGNPDRALITFSNYGINSVWVVDDLNSPSPTWTNVEGNLPDMPVRWGMFHPEAPQQAIIATELGVWTTNVLDAGSTIWTPTNDGLANVRVDMLQYRPSDGTVVAATHGRGMFTALLGSSGTPPPARVVFYNEDFSSPTWTPGGDNGGGSEAWEWSNDPSGIFYNQPDFQSTTAANGFYSFNSDFNGQFAHDVTLTSPAINCSEADTVLLEFSNQYAYFSNNGISNPQVGISTDGIHFTYLPVLSQVIRGSLSESNRIVRLDITPYAALEEQVYIQFRWQGFWEYIWRVDDITLVTFESAARTCPPERDYLLDLFSATDGNNWFNAWDTTSCDPCTWFGITCNPEDEIISIDLSGNNLSGALPESLPGLTTLESIDLSNNDLQGCFPVSYESFCGSLTTANFSGNAHLVIPNGDLDVFCALGSAACSMPFLDTCITSVDHLILDDPIISSGSYQAMDSIELLGMIEPGDSAVLAGGQSIIFKAGFHAAPGSFVHAKIMDCTSPDLPPARPNPEPVAESDLYPDVPGHLGLYVWPNPFEENAQIAFTLPEKGKLKLQVFSSAGQLISQPFHGQLSHAGRYQLDFDGSRLPSGVYIMILDVDGQRETFRMVKL